MRLIYTITGQEARIDKIEEPDAVVEVPEELEGCPVTELGAYVLSGAGVEELHLPPYLKKIGAYGFYGCESLRRIYCYSRVTDLGAGLFAGVRTVELLDITEFEGEKSCFMDMLSELRQTLRVRVRRGADDEGAAAGRSVAAAGGSVAQGAGADEARLIFPEYYEESVENTPARILFIETHGCGHRYRYCFANRQFQYLGYDELFPHAKVQEAEELVTELALGRLLFPCGLTERYRAMYLGYVREHWETAGKLLIAADRGSREAVTNLEAGGLPWLMEEVLDKAPDKKTDKAPEESSGEPDPAKLVQQAGALISLAQQAGDTEMVSWLMDFRRQRRIGAERAGAEQNGEAEGGTGDGADTANRQPKRKRRFEL